MTGTPRRGSRANAIEESLHETKEQKCAGLGYIIFSYWPNAPLQGGGAEAWGRNWMRRKAPRIAAVTIHIRGKGSKREGDKRRQGAGKAPREIKRL